MRCLFRHSSLKRMSTTFKKMYQSTLQQLPGTEEEVVKKKRFQRFMDSWAFNRLTPETKWTTYQDFSTEAVMEILEDRKRQKRIKSQSFDMKRYNNFGPELSAAQFVVKIGGKVKIDDYPEWVPITDDPSSMPLPEQRLDKLKLEGLDLSGTNLVFEGYRNFVNLQHIKYIRVHDSDFLDDFNLTQFVLFRDTLEFLDISGCPKLTWRGLAWLHHLENLKCLKLDNLKGVDDPEIVLDLVCDMLPNCQVQGTIGISPAQEETEHAPSKPESISSTEL
ncbi:ATP synthase subunit s-like protein isoform X2 [Mizuhopecten yessoensis]|uniref:ATP synthase subunit s-like protein isoform X2 n=1 Tax=Mizuhopecten yessoensis TaxID=6573 RepID=UPI000B457CA8|nr:ATP synthase subunit s-like protein isoform X2 [Mizuhopecten yessoensis]